MRNRFYLQQGAGSFSIPLFKVYLIHVISFAILVISGIGLYFSVPYVFYWFFCKFLDCVLDSVELGLEVWTKSVFDKIEKSNSSSEN